MPVMETLHEQIVNTQSMIVLTDGYTKDEQAAHRWTQQAHQAGIVVNYNAIPFDPRKPGSPSGIRLGTAAVTSRGFGAQEMAQLGEWINAVISDPENEKQIAEIARDIATFCGDFPPPGIRVR